MFLLICANTTGAQTGTVLEQGTNIPLQNALVSLKSTGDLVLTDVQGRFEFAGSPVRYGISKHIKANPVTFHNGILNIFSLKPSFVLEIYKPDGTRITKIKSQSRIVDFNSYIKSSYLYILQISIESSVYIMNVVSSSGHLTVASPNSSVLNSSTNLRQHAHTFAGKDTLIVSKYLYTPVSQAVAAVNTIYLSMPATPPPPPGMKSVTGGGCS